MGIIASNITGFLREAVIANYFGATRLADVYLIAFTVPEYLFALLTITVGAALVPLLTQHLVHQACGDKGTREHEDDLRYGDKETKRQGARRTFSLSPPHLVSWPQPAVSFLQAVVLFLTLILALVSVIGILAAPWYLRWLAPGFSSEDLALTAQLDWIMFPAVILWGLSASASAVLNVYRRFTLPALATAAYNTVFILAAVLLRDRLSLHALAWGVLLGATAHLSIQLPQLWQIADSRWHIAEGLRLSAISHRPSATSQFGRLAAPIALGYSVHHLSIIVDRAMASSLAPGSIAALNYGYRVPLIIGQVLGMAVATAFFPALSQQAVSGETAELRATLSLGLKVLILLGLPAMAGLAVLRVPVIQILFQRGAFDQRATAVTATILLFYAGGVFADMLCQPLWRALYALQEAATVAYINGVKTVLRIVFNLALIPLLSYNGIALSFSLGLTLQLAMLCVLVSRRIGSFIDRGIIDFTARVAGASAIMAAVCYAVAIRLDAFLDPSGPAGQVLLITTTTLVGALVFVATAHALGIHEITSAVSWVGRQLGKIGAKRAL